MLGYFVALGLGLAGGAGCSFILLEWKFRQAREYAAKATAKEVHAEKNRQELEQRESQFNSEALAASKRLKKHEHEFEKREREFELQLSRRAAAADQEFERRMALVNADKLALANDRRIFDARIISQDELQNENLVLKRDLRNLNLFLRKQSLDLKLQEEETARVETLVNELAARWMRDNLKWIDSKLGTNNYGASKQRLTHAIGWCRTVGFDVSPEHEQELVEELKANYEKVVRIALDREEQARIKAQIREETRLQQEQQRELEQAEAEKRRIQAALDQALQDERERHALALDQQTVALDEHAAEIEQLRASLAEANARSERAIFMAQLTKAGHVYVISNVGAFGEGVFKVGMTRRLEPLERVKELGDASVPFPFDVHMMISCENAPSLENALHRELHHHRVNAVNPRKEFFRTDIEAIRAVVERHHGVVEYVADPEALEYRQSLTMSLDDKDYIEQVYESVANNECDEFLTEEAETE